MAKYHINNSGEAKPCRAKEGNCRFGGASGNENHYATAEEAEARSAQILAQRYGEVASAQKRVRGQVDRPTREKLFEYGMTSGGKKATEREVIEESFKNNEEQYRLFKKFTKEEKGLSKETKKSIGDMMTKGLNVRASSQMSSFHLNEAKDMMEKSDIDVIEETPKTKGKRMSIEELLKRHGSPF